MSDTKVLYIEDEEDYQHLISRLLTAEGYHIETAGTGEEGLKKLAHLKPDLLILDINLPDTDGFTICSQLRKEPAWADLPILMLTVRKRPDEWLEGFARGADDYVQKPLNPPELLERVASCLGRRPGRFQNEGKPEFQLVQSVLAGNRGAYGVLIAQHRARLHDYVLSECATAEVADDIVSSVFMTALESLGTFKGDSKFYTWLQSIAQNKISRFGRVPTMVSIEGLEENDESGLHPALVSEDTVSRTLVRQLDVGHLRRAIRCVPEPFREILKMNLMQEKPYETIAQQLDIPLGTVMSRIHKGRTVLRAKWNKGLRRKLTRSRK